MHAVGPIWGGGKRGEELYLQVCVRNCLDKAEELGYQSIAMPAISSGIFGFPKDLCAKVMIEAVIAFLDEKAGSQTLREIHFTNFDEVTTKLFEQELQAHIPRMNVPPSAEDVARAEQAASEAEAHHQHHENVPSDEPDTATADPQSDLPPPPQDKQHETDSTTH